MNHIKQINKIIIPIILGSGMVLNLRVVTAETTTFHQQIYPIVECNDGKDNDGDGLVDFSSDPDCTAWTDNSELLLTASTSSTTTSASATEGTDSISTQRSNSSPSNTSGSSVLGIQSNFIWRSLGQVLGIEDSDIFLRIGDNNFAYLILCCLGSILLVAMLIIFIGTKRNQRDSN